MLELKQKEGADLLSTKWSESYDIVKDNTIIGHVVINEQPDMFQVFKLEIYPQYRRKGYAEQFFKQLQKVNTKIRLAVDVNNSAAISLYKKLGFVVTGKKMSSATNGFQWMDWKTSADGIYYGGKFVELCYEELVDLMACFRETKIDAETLTQKKSKEVWDILPMTDY